VSFQLDHRIRPLNSWCRNIFERRYGLSEADASTKASYLLAGSIILYPVVCVLLLHGHLVLKLPQCGWIVDRVQKRGFITRMLLLSSCLTLSCYAWLSLPPSWTGSPVPAIAAFGTALGFSPLLLVVLVPQLIPLKYVPTTLGAHKAVRHIFFPHRTLVLLNLPQQMEKVGESIFQTVAGLTLDVSHKKKTLMGLNADEKSSQALLQTFFCLNLVQLTFVLCLSYLQRQKTSLAEREESVPLPTSRRGSRVISETEYASALSDADAREQQRPLLERSPTSHSLPPSIVPASTRLAHDKSAVARRGRTFAKVSLGLLALAWVLFLGTAAMRLRSKVERGG
jgi:hypothetical protein